MLVAPSSQPTMEASKDHTSSTTDANNGMTGDTQWKTLDRKHVNKLLDYSHASYAEEFSSQLNAQSGWEEAVQGWSGCAPMSCLFQLQKKCKKAKTGDNDYHCLICIDAKLSQNPKPDFPPRSESSKANYCLPEEREDKGFEVRTKYQGRTSSSTSAISCPNKVPEPSPLNKGKEVVENLIVFPPMQRSSFPRRTMEVTRSLETCSLHTTNSLMAENASYVIPVSMEMCDEGEEAAAGSHMVTKVSEDNYGLTSKYRPCHSSRNAFRMSIPRRYSTSCDALPQATNLLGKKVKCDTEYKMSTKSNQCYRTRRIEPNLSVLGTRIQLLSASDRIL